MHVANTGSCTCSDGAYKCVVCMQALLLVRTGREPWWLGAGSSLDSLCTSRHVMWICALSIGNYDWRI